MGLAKTQARALTFVEEFVAATPEDSHLEYCCLCGSCSSRVHPALP